MGIRGNKRLLPGLDCNHCAKQWLETWKENAEIFTFFLHFHYMYWSAYYYIVYITPWGKRYKAGDYYDWIVILEKLDNNSCYLFLVKTTFPSSAIAA